MPKKYEQNDKVILIVDEPKKAKKHNRIQKRAYLDTIDTIQGNKAITKTHKFKTMDLYSADEDEIDKTKRKNRNEAEMKCFYMDESFFPTIKGLVYDIESIDLDVDFIKNVVEPFDFNRRIKE